MGYCTDYTLVIEPNDGEVWISLRHRFEEQVWFDTNGQSEEPVKWYSHEKDLREFSKSYPETLFILHGAGEANADMWKKYFRNGLCQSEKAVIQIAPFDERKLK